MDLIGFIGYLIARNFVFKSIWALIRRNLSSRAKIYFLGIYLGPIRGLIVKIRNQGPIWKRRKDRGGCLELIQGPN